MKLSLSKYLIIAFGVFLISNSYAQREWNSRKNKDGVEVFVKDDPNSKLKTYMAVGTTTAPISDCVSFLLDLENHINWSYNVVESTLIPTSTNEHTCYMIMEAPWPVDDRDIVVQATTEHFSEDKVEVTLIALPGLKDEVDGMVRVTESVTTWLFERKDGVTHLTYTGLSDPGGNIPDWMVNALIVDGPFDTIRNFLELVSK